jgi:hypothetical protein
MLCCFCDEIADDRPGAPLCVGCWDRIERQVAEKKESEPLRVASWGEPDLVELLHGVFASGGLVTGTRSAAMAQFSSLGNLCGPSPADTIN